jgi:hypothetical protein
MHTDVSMCLSHVNVCVCANVCTGREGGRDASRELTCERKNAGGYHTEDTTGHGDRSTRFGYRTNWNRNCTLSRELPQQYGNA